MDPVAYNDYVEDMRREQYPMLQDAIYLDHAGTTLYSKAQMDRFHRNMMENLMGNPHSASPSSQQSTHLVDGVRSQLLHFFHADPEHFDLVFTANATAGIKLVMEALREQDGGFWYGYHMDSHTSLAGVREAASEHSCFETDEEVERWVDDNRAGAIGKTRLFAYPAQSNMNGRRLPLSWPQFFRQRSGNRTYTLLDAAAYASTSPLDLSDAVVAPDFTALSLYKIFGFPDLGALIVRKDAAHVFQKRRYFGGGTVDMVVCLKEQWHAKKSGHLHEQLEDGTLPIHSILALKSAMETHAELFGTLERVSQHTAMLAEKLYDGLAALKHGNGENAVRVYKDVRSDYRDRSTQGPIVAFNLRDSRGQWVSNTEVEKLATVKNVHLRTGGLCNPGGIASSLNLSPWEMRENFSAGHRCGGENDVLNGKPTGMIRVSFGAMSTLSDVERFSSFIDDFFVDKNAEPPRTPSPVAISGPGCSNLHIESLTVYPIKSCAGCQVPANMDWEIRSEGLAWDREWCIVHQGTSAALSQKRYPRMALIRPTLDFKSGRLRIGLARSDREVSVPLSLDPTYLADRDWRSSSATVCGDAVQARWYTSTEVTNFLTQALGVPCTLARFPRFSGSRHSKAHLRSPHQGCDGVRMPILLSNESPILTISRSSLNRLNEQIKAKGGKAAHQSVFRANIIVAESPLLSPGQERPWAEDGWESMQMGDDKGPVLDFLGGCRRCQMVCVDQETAEKNEEPFVTLAKTRRFGGRVLFGVHTAMRDENGSGGAMVRVGDAVRVRRRENAS